MKWQTKEIDTYLQQKEYIDTAIIPLIPISWQSEVKSTVAMGEFISIISLEVERQFQGRVIHFPSFSYLKSESIEERLKRLNDWVDELKSGGVAHVVLLTSDGEWKSVEDQLNRSLIWLPTIPLEHVDIQIKRDIIAEQLKQLVPVLMGKWQQGLSSE